jgi:hypothetical protein
MVKLMGMIQEFWEGFAPVGRKARSNRSAAYFQGTDFGVPWKLQLYNCIPTSTGFRDQVTYHSTGVVHFSSPTAGGMSGFLIFPHFVALHIA